MLNRKVRRPNWRQRQPLAHRWPRGVAESGALARFVRADWHCIHLVTASQVLDAAKESRTFWDARMVVIINWKKIFNNYKKTPKTKWRYCWTRVNSWPYPNRVKSQASRAARRQSRPHRGITRLKPTQSSWLRSTPSLTIMRRASCTSGASSCSLFFCI